MFIVVILCLLMIFFLNYKILGKSYSILNPVSISVYVWFLVIIFHNYYFEYEEYTGFSYSVIALGNIFLALGFWGMSKQKIVFGRYNSNTKMRSYNTDGIKKILKVLTYIEILRILYNVYIIIYKLAGSWSVFLHSNTYVRNLYLRYSGGTIANLFEFFCNSNALIAYALVGISLARGTKKEKLYFFLWSALELMYALVTMSKMCLIIYVIIVATAFINNLDTNYEQRRAIKKYLPMAILAVLGFLLLIGMQRNYVQKDGGLINIVLKKAGVYFSGPVEAFGKYVSLYGCEWTFGTKTFIVFSRVLSRLGISADTTVLAHGEDIFIGYESINAYTWYKVFYQDFSYIGTMILPMLMGVLAGVFYSRREHDFFGDTCCAWISAVIAMSFYTFMWGQTIYIFILLYAYVIHKLCTNVLYKK